MNMMSDIDPVDLSMITYMQEVAILRDNQPIRACCFSSSGDYFVLGTNSKALKICSLPKLNNGGELDGDEDGLTEGDMMIGRHGTAVDSSGGLNNDEDGSRQV